MELLRRLQDSIQTTQPGALLIPAGAFLVTVHPENPLPWFNDAVPVAEPAPGDVDHMLDVFREHGRRPRLEFFLELWPEVPTLLAKKGFRLKDRQPALALRRKEWKGRTPSMDVRIATADDSEAINEVADVAFEGDGPDPNRVTAIRESITAGRSRAAIAFANGKAVGCGRIVGMPDVREVISIGTLPEFRRRGIATAVTAALLEDFFATGGEIAWLSATPDADSVYRALGFAPVATQACYVMDEYPQ